jgi:hypothetical protein
MRHLIRFSWLVCVFLLAVPCLVAQSTLEQLSKLKDYSAARAGSYDVSGGNTDSLAVAPGATVTLAEVSGPGAITHTWFTISSGETFHLKKLVLRMYWDGETTPSVEAPIGDFFGLGLGEYLEWNSAPMNVAPLRSLNSYWYMPFARSARVTLTNEGKQRVGSFYYNFDLRKLKSLSPDTGYFHAQYRQATPNRGTSEPWTGNADMNKLKNPKGEGNYVMLEATGRGHFVGVTHSVLQNQDFWWGEGDEMIFIDGSDTPQIIGTGSEDYYTGSWDFQKPFSYPYAGAPLVGIERAGSRSSAYRFHIEDPVPFEKSIKVTMEHGHANHRSDSWFTVAYWYQTEPHGAFPPLPPVDARLPQLYPTGGPGNAGVPAGSRQ